MDASASGPLEDGLAWATAFTDLQQALSASVSGDEIRVADGTYRPTSGTDRTLSFNLKSGVKVLGGYAGYSAGNPDVRSGATPSILSGDIGITGDDADNSYHVVHAGGTNYLDGFTITGGNSNGPTSSNNKGAGLDAFGAYGTLSNCIFTQNRSSGVGAALYARISGFSVQNCTFTGNISGTYGAVTVTSESTPGINGSNVRFQNCDFSNNTANSGPAALVIGGTTGTYTSASVAHVYSCNFINNAGGAIGVGGPGVPSVNDCRIIGNSAVNEGGVTVGDSTVAFNRCIIQGNTATQYGGGIYCGSGLNGTFESCIFNSNSAGNHGGGVYAYGGGPTYVNCLFVGNSALMYGESNQVIIASPREVSTSCDPLPMLSPPFGSILPRSLSSPSRIVSG